MEYFIDSNIFLRTLIREDAKSFKECLAFLTKVKENKIKAYTSSLVLAEIVWTLISYYEFEKNKVVRAIESITNLRGLKLKDESDPRYAINLYTKHAVKFIDCLIASDKKVQKRKAVIISYDKDFDKLKVLRQEPSI